MSEKHVTTWEPSQKQVAQIILPAMQNIAQQCAGYINQLECPPEFVSIMLRDIADAFENPDPDGESDCSCC